MGGEGSLKLIEFNQLELVGKKLSLIRRNVHKTLSFLNVDMADNKKK